ncbi:GFA family protein [Pseudoxanthomonas gei]|uniref:GFA family protein n=1 Tax=Pseudoxanthomonas gei TaxID=1383030 RepID=A0ABX0AGP8_9GAMM|nr:GFA family protein [Pseudoxanthomonas gei]NDK39757.1 GFA family protein [Pseudoxanthomonas gei]
MTTAHAQCLCGEVKLEATLPSKWVAHCHCSLCRRAHGAAFVTWVGMEAARCVIDDPAQRLRWYQSTPGAERGFCSHCGTMMLFRSPRWPGELHIALAHFTTPLDRAPQVHAHWDDHVPWASIDPDDGLPRKP